MLAVCYFIWWFREYATGSFSYSAVRREHHPQQMVQSLVDGTSYIGLSPGEDADDLGSDPLTGHLELWTGSFWRTQSQNEHFSVL